MEITVFGKGCSRCESTIHRIESEAQGLGVPVTITKITDEIEIIQNGIMTTPAVKIDNKIVHSGGIPSIEAVQSWLRATSSNYTVL
ncbi:MAG: thioredoxin family protein [Alphaproteobacteria bacterium]|nr:thioredoxin family protein [Alphaproteobacteria bacterium]MCB1551538.1 thioredoxin family protein [Alphaproteobacteria bacterium]MCB9984549.1 thioredoxin family protein [Micavibrio sp.]